MIVPQFSIRTILAVMTGCAVFFLIVGMAYRGQTAAWGVTIGVLGLAITALVHAAWFGIVWLFSQLSRQSEPATGLEAWLTAADLPTPTAPSDSDGPAASNDQEDRT